MNAAQFLLADGKPSGLWYCGQCWKTQNRMTEGDAEKCCRPRICQECHKPIIEDKTVAHYTLFHNECSRAREAAKEAAWMEKAEKLDVWDGWVFLDGAGSNEGFFESVGDLVEYLLEQEDQEEEEYQTAWPEYVFICNAKRFVNVDADWILEDIGTDVFQEWDADTLNGIPELKAAIEAFNEANKDQFSYETDHKRVVKVHARSGFPTTQDTTP